jgi:hypothetical protein
MAGMYTRDKIKVIPITKAMGTGAITRGTSFNVKVMIEEETNMISGGAGRPVQSDIYMFVPPGTAIKKGDMIQVIEKFGKVIAGEPERTVLQVSPYGSYVESHMEVYA